MLYNNIYVKLHNVVGVTLNYNKKVIIYMNIKMSIAIVPDIKSNFHGVLNNIHDTYQYQSKFECVCVDVI